MNEELRALFEEDRGDAQAFRGDEAFIASQGRRARVAALLDGGAVQTAEDFYHASFLFQHGEQLAHWAQAHLLARTAADLGHPRARYQAAAAYDRWLLRQGRPQKYGTNSVLDGDRWRVGATDPTTSDAERAAWDVPPWAALLARGEQAFGGQSVRETWARPFVTVTLNGTQIGLFDLDPTPPTGPVALAGHPAYTRPAPTDPHPAALPPDLTPWRFGSLFCAKDPAGQVVCAWHACRWQVLTPDAPDAVAAIYVQIAGLPQPLSPPDAFWSRLGLATGPDRCWLIGGHLPRATLEQLVRSLP